jgi:HPt (histidine-containing phosphotransfer) domain-containing protein
MNTYKLIDLTYLKDLSDGSDGFVEKMLLLFLEQMPEAISNLEKHFHNQDWNSLRTTAHKLKASYMFIGVKELPEMVGSVEEYAANRTKLDVLPVIISDIKNISHKILEELEKERQSLG